MKELSNDVKQDLELIGVLLSDMNESNLFESKQFSCNYFIFDTEKQYTNHIVHINEIVGTIHPSYHGLSFLDIFINLKRRERIVSNFIKNPLYYTEKLKQNITQDENDRPTFVKINNEYYVNTGNHRVTICKLKNFDYIKGYVTEYILNPHKQNLWNEYISRGFKLEYDLLKDRLKVIFNDDYLYFEDRSIYELTDFLNLYDQISTHRLGYFKNRGLRSQSKNHNYSSAHFQFGRVFHKLLEFKKSFC